MVPSTGDALPRAEIDAWIHAHLSLSGRGLTGEITEVKETRWSTVLAVPAGAGRLFFKAVWSAQAYEVSATALLAALSPHGVPAVVAADEDRGWMLLSDAGEPLDRRQRTDQLTLLPEAVRQYAQVQLASVPHVSEFLSAGVPDRRHLRPRLDRLVAGYPSGRGDTLTAAEVARLRDLSGEVGAMEQHLAEVVPASVEHGDLHAGNIAVDAENRPRFFDWADISVAFPFLSLAKLLGSLEESLGLVPGGPASDAIVAAYLAPFGLPVGGSDTATLVHEARVLGSISRAVTWDHITRYFPRGVREEFPDPVASSLRDCLRLERDR